MKVKITCYGHTEVLERQAAIKKYREAIDWSEGAERDRYVNVYLGLLDGLAEVSDGE